MHLIYGFREDRVIDVAHSIIKGKAKGFGFCELSSALIKDLADTL